MNKFFKRLALLLAVLMIVSMMPVQLFADNSVTGEGQSNGTTQNKAVASYELNGETISFEGETIREVNTKMRKYWEVDDAHGCSYNADKLPADGKGALTWTIYGTVGQGEYLNSGALILPALSGGYIYKDGTYQWQNITVVPGDKNATIVSNDTFDVNHIYVSNGANATTTFTGITLDGSLYVVPNGTVTFDGCVFKGMLRVPSGNGVVKVANCQFVGDADEDSTGKKNEYPFFFQAGGTLEFIGNTIAADTYKRGLNVGGLTELNATIENNTIGAVTAGYSAIQLSGKVTEAQIKGNKISLDGTNAFTLHESLISANKVTKVTVEGNKITGNGYLIYDDAVANSKAFTSENLKLTIGTNTVASTVDTTQGVKESNKYDISETVATVVNEALKPAYVATVNGVGYATLAEAIAAAKDGDTIYVSAGEYTTYDNASPKKSLIFVGAGAGNTIWTIGDLSKNVDGEGNGDYSFDGCDTITFKDMTLKVDNANYRGFIRINHTIVENCTLEGRTAYWGYETATFTGCTFNAPEGDYALWDYSTKTMTFDGCEFNISGKGVNVYVEAGNAGSEARKVEAKDCTINSTKANKAFLNIKNSTQAYEVTLSGDNKVNGLGANSTTGSNLYQVEATTITETDGKTVKVQEKASDGTLTTVYEVKAASTAVATVGGVEYATLAEAIAALNSTNHTLTLIDASVWDAATPVYWQAGAQSGYAAKLTDALTAAYKANAGDITIVCRPGADVGAMTHGHVADNLTVYGNNAYISGGECDLEVDTCMYSRETGKQVATGGVYLDKAITITAYELDNLGVWGQRHTDHTINISLNDCDGKAIEGKANVQRVYISVKTGVNNITVVGCDFLTKATALYSNADGETIIDNCSFAGSQVPVNFNHKANGTQTVTVKNSTFTNCGDDGEWKQFAAPVRFVNSGSGTSTATVDNCTFTETVGANGDILLGDGRNGEASNDVALTVTNTAATVVAQRPGYYNGETTDTTKAASKGVTASETFKTSIDEMVVINVTGYVEDENGNVTISTAEGLFWFAKQVNSGNNFAGKTVKLANDIDLNNERWTPIGIYNDSKTHFKGTFDGQNHTVSGLNVVESGKKGVGFFGKAFTGTIKNLTVEGNITADGCDYVGGIVGHGYATITNCVFKGDITNNSGYQIGGIAGSGGFTITNCSVYGNIHGESWVGGIAGNVQDGGAYINCYVEGVISANSSYDGASAAGIAAIPLYKSQKINGCYSNTIVKCGDEVINAPIIGCYNGNNNITADTELFIHDNSWNKQKNPNDSYEVKERNTVIEGKTVSRDNNLIMLEDDLEYVEGDLSAVRIMAGSAVTQEQVDALAMAQIGDRKYTSLDTAIAAANAGDTVTLLADVTAYVVIDKNITLDLGGKTLNGGTGNTKATITNYGTITITDSSAEKTGTIKRDDNGTEGETSYYVIRNFGTMTIEQANIINNSGYKKTNPSGSMVGSSLICNGDDDAYSAVLNIKGGTIRQDNFIAIKNGSSATLNVTGGKITSKHSAVQNWCNANITGGELNGQLWTDSWDSNSTGNTVMGGDAKFTGEIVIDITGSIVPKFKITGGTLDVTNWGITTAAANAGAKPAVSGGTFSSAVPEEYCADRYIPTQNEDGTYGVKEATKGSKKNPYNLAELSEMTRADYIEAQEALGGTMYVEIGDYSYGTNGVLGNGVRNDTPGQTPDHSKLNSYGENGYIGANNDGANGKKIIFVGGSITSGVTGYTSIDNIGTSLLLAVPAYTKVTFEGVTFKNVISFDYQLYTSPWSQLGELKFSGCTFNGIIVGAIAAQTLTFDGCEFKNYTNKISANNSNPTWIRPAYGNWSKGDNDGQGSDFKSLTTINFTNNTVTSTRPVKFEYISQWDITSTVTATGNYFDITAQSDDDDTSIKNVGLYLGAHTDANEFHLVAADNTKSENTAALYTIPSGKTSLPVDSTVKNTAGESIELTDALKWKATDAEKDKIVLKTVIAVASIGERRFATLEEAVAAVAKNGEEVTIKLLSNITAGGIDVAAGQNIVFDFDGHTYTLDGSMVGSTGTKTNGFRFLKGSTVVLKNGTLANGNGSPAKAMINSYATLKLVDFSVDARTTAVAETGSAYGYAALYISNGVTTVTGNGNYTTSDDNFVILIANVGDYTDGASLVFDENYTGTVSGKVSTGNKQNATVEIKNGKFDLKSIDVENTNTTVTISGGKFKNIEIAGKYLDNKAFDTEADADGYYAVMAHPIESFGVTVGEGLSLRLYVRDEYRNGKLLIKYVKPNGRDGETIEKELKINSVIENVNGTATIRYCARIFNITPQMADVVIKVQYVDETGVAIGSEKEVSILKYCQNYVKEDSPESVKIFISKLLEYCATAMDYRIVTNADEVYSGNTWQKRAEMLRKEKVSICGEANKEYKFENLGTYTNIGETFTTRGMEYDSVIKIFFAIDASKYNSNYKYYLNGNEISPIHYTKDDKDQYRFYFTIAPYEYHNSIRITIKNGEDDIGEYACSLDIILESFSKKSGNAELDALARLSVAAYEYCRSLADYPTSKDFNQ
ncbi:MAG: hypothetical protein KH352_04235 [Ruminococcus sp.]|nr:hypothetical protein [Candidatus Apopatosoma intestinale]